MHKKFYPWGSALSTRSQGMPGDRGALKTFFNAFQHCISLNYQVRKKIMNAFFSTICLSLTGNFEAEKSILSPVHLEAGCGRFPGGNHIEIGRLPPRQPPKSQIWTDLSEKCVFPTILTRIWLNLQTWPKMAENREEFDLIKFSAKVVFNGRHLKTTFVWKLGSIVGRESVRQTKSFPSSSDWQPVTKPTLSIAFCHLDHW